MKTVKAAGNKTVFKGGRMRTLAAIACLSALLALWPRDAAAATYILQDLGSLGEVRSYAEEVNASGQVAGFRGNAAPHDVAFLYTDLDGDGRTDSGEMSDLPTLGGADAQAYGLNASGWVVGYSYTADNKQHAFLWRGDAGLQDLGVLLAGHSYASAISDAGQVAGLGDFGSGYRAFLYTDSDGDGQTDEGEMQDLGTLGGAESKGYGMNNAHQVVGSARTAAGDEHAFLFTDANADGARNTGDTMRDLGTLGGATSKAYHVNDLGFVVGYSKTSDGEQHAFVWDPVAKELIDLGGVNAVAESINDIGAAVGYSAVAGSLRAFLWQDGAMTDLNTLIDPASGWVLTLALDINDRGQIVGVGSYGGETTRGFLLTPVPEPVSVIFLGTGIAGVAGFVSRRRMRRS